MKSINHVIVAIPARNEATRLATALKAVQSAIASCPVPVTVIVAADACTDATATIAAAHGAAVVSSDAGRVGTARAAAITAALKPLQMNPELIWIANTDADSKVPSDWLTVHLEFAGRGITLLRGTVRPDAQELAEEQLFRWIALNAPNEDHEHIHGANLGLTAAAYLAAGGFQDLALQEDVELVRQVEAQGGRTASTARAPVTTSARPIGRLHGGFATYLREQVL